MIKNDLNQFEVPIVLIIFNRFDITQHTLQILREFKPKQLFVIGDGPRKHIFQEQEKINRTRDVIQTVDWGCDLEKKYSNINLGCKENISQGLTWVFNQVHEAIILEDDCVPDLSFFRFCRELLEYYRHDRRVMAISGDNFQLGKCRTEYSYYFSRYPHCWGWATWRRAWQLYDEQMSLWPEIRDGGWLNDILLYKPEERYRRKIFQRVYENKIDTWDYRWTLTCWQQNGLTVLPKVNLVSNIGFGDDGSHTKDKYNPFSRMSTENLDFPLKHPPFLIRDARADRFTYRIMFSFWTRARRKLLSILKKRI